MNSNFKVVAAAVAAVLGSGAALADSSTATATSGTPAAYRAPANVDFRIVIPAFLYFQVGAAAAGTVNQVDFLPAAANVGNSVAVAGSASVTVVLKGNNGAITIDATNSSGGLGLGTGTASDGYIDYASIATTVTGDAALLAPTLANTATSTAAIAVTAGKVTNRTATWSYAYANTTFPSAGTYGTSTNGGRVTYTAVMP
jgi:hypothetical protein